MGVGMLRVTAVSVCVVVVVAAGSFSSVEQEVRSIMAQAGSAGNRRVNFFIMSVFKGQFGASLFSGWIKNQVFSG
jgi:hypothetical protein